MKRVVPSERFRRELDDLLAGVEDADDPIERIGRLGARLILQQALEDEVSEFLGRVRYERAADPVSHRNGYEPRKVVTTTGPVRWKRSPRPIRRSKTTSGRCRSPPSAVCTGASRMGSCW